MFAATLATVLAAASVTAPAPAPVAAPSPAPVATNRQADPRVCVVSRITGSLIPVKQCQKYSDWLADGTDPLAKSR